MSLWVEGEGEGDGARREDELDERMRSTESVMTQTFRTKKEGQFKHYSRANEVSSVAFIGDDQWRINHRQCQRLSVVSPKIARVANPKRWWWGGGSPGPVPTQERRYPIEYPNLTGCILNAARD